MKNRIYRISSSFVRRNIGGEIIFVPVTSTTNNPDKSIPSVYSLNKVGNAICDLIDGNKCVKEIKDAIIEKFEVSEEQIDSDLTFFLGILKDKGFIEVL